MEFTNRAGLSLSDESKVTKLNNVEDLFDPYAIWYLDQDDEEAKDFAEFGIGGPA